MGQSRTKIAAFTMSVASWFYGTFGILFDANPHLKKLDLEYFGYLFQLFVSTGIRLRENKLATKSASPCTPSSTNVKGPAKGKPDFANLSG